MTYADKLEKLADEWVPWDFPAIPLRSDQDYAASINLKLQGFNVADGSGAALARKVAALVREHEELIRQAQRVLSFLDVSINEARNHKFLLVEWSKEAVETEATALLAALEQARKALADIEGEGE